MPSLTWRNCSSVRCVSAINPVREDAEIFTKIIVFKGFFYSCDTVFKLGTRWRSWMRQCATSQKVAVSIHDCVTGTFH